MELNLKFIRGALPFCATPLALFLALGPYFLLKWQTSLSTAGSQWCRVIFYLFFLVAAIILSRRASVAAISTPRWDIAAVVVTACWALSLPGYGSFIATRARRSDLGWVVEQAVRCFFLDRSNPYAVTIQTTAGTQGMDGFHYGPMMMFGYVAVLWNLQRGVLITNIAVSAILCAALVVLVKPFCGRERWRSNAVVVIAALIIVPQFRFQVLAREAPDIFPTTLMIWALAFIRLRWMLWAGAAVGLSISAKLAPGIFIALLMVRRDYSREFVVGCALGLASMAPFLISDPYALWVNSVYFHFVKPHNFTSLYAHLPNFLHLTAKIILTIAFAAVWLRAAFRPLEVRDVTLHLLALMTFAEIASKEMHLNHTIWFMPLYALMITWYRTGLCSMVRSSALEKAHSRDSHSY